MAGLVGWTRRPLHASSWYTDNRTALEAQLEGWLENVDSREDTAGGCAGIIVPHAGYSYSGPTAAFGYGYVCPEKVKRVFILGPSHHVYLDNCALTQAVAYATPLGNLVIDQGVNKELESKADKNTFQVLAKDADEEEHSIEMHLPYVAHIMKGKDFKIVPILVGNLSSQKEQYLGKLLAPYLDDASNLFVISSDFCHWGSRFRYQRYKEVDGEIFQSIEKLDHEGMRLIENKDVSGFKSYLKDTKNTICGRHPISVFMNAIEHSPLAYKVKFTKYAQSSKCRRGSDSSVSYASAVAFRDQC
mmetsp:Transcript_10726/g.17565  ORF Transcript_10726/g.17565 Transcript_10726/m.17565 type:complete len:302 (-) Transcript_10726:149-1054(-)|eukprot:CAMPEP_0203790170 /NCGR_PEP_ID=MMETSP0100_2-20121128/3893_1 /ASSEMBLY_ACC=CAM_ASM_000210 /TAXON_ID=96639 /ORGANISM=" , Strain NY0313808BC1" /LENGTH=301 /DNA_ID=CAMNT_0050693273 /DNA_START=250 /DNA_END=1155 /DNA_ORIENTATION=+